MYARGHAVSATRFAGNLYYRMQAVLAGKARSLPCRRSQAGTPGGGLALNLEVCLPEEVDLDAASLMPAFGRAAEELGEYFPGVAVSSLEIVVLPFGTRYYSSKRGLRKPDDLALRFAFWWGEDADASLRNAIRSFSHEVTHLAVKAQRRRLSSGEEEVLASSFENCIEFAVFGSVSHDPDDMGDALLLERVEAASLRRSIAASLAVTRESDAWLGEENLTGMRQRCRGLLDAS